MTTETIDAPAVPFTLPDAKPSQIVRSLSEDHWTQRVAKVMTDDGLAFWCAAGILLEHAGYQWPEREGVITVGECRTWQVSKARIALTLGIGFDQAAALTHANDTYGKDAAADLLESWGM